MLYSRRMVLNDSVSRPLDDFAAHDHAMSIPLEQVVRELVELLSAPVVALLGGVSETRAVQQWMSGRQPQRPQVLRFALQLATMIASEQQSAIAQAWFQGCNPHLNDAIPALLLRNSSLAEVQERLIAAARAFATRNTGSAPPRDATKPGLKRSLDP